MTTTIIGAGLAGLLAAHAWPQFPVVEASDEPTQVHRALLRFRTDSVSKLTGIPFKRVRVRKGIWSGGRFHAPSIRLANMHSLKCLKQLLPDRSIWNIDPVDRFVAPDTFYEELIDNVGSRISWNTTADWTARGAKISTAPLPLTMNAHNIVAARGVAFERAAITVARARIQGCDVYQTVYYPGDDTPMYRASITGDHLIIEAAESDIAPREWMPRALVLIAGSFGIPRDLITTFSYASQRFGKIAPVPDPVRKAAMFELTQKHSVYSLGRFATWRNILLDDVVDDIAVIKRLMHASSYDLLHASATR